MERHGKVGWTKEEDRNLRDYVNANGAHHWETMARNLGMGRSGNSCRLRWFNYLSPHTRRGGFSDQETLLVLNLHRQLGNRWSKIAKELPGRTDNDIKNFWNTRVVKEAKQLNCDVNGGEFLDKMTARLTEGTGINGGNCEGGDCVILCHFWVCNISWDGPKKKVYNISWGGGCSSNYSCDGSIPEEFWSNLDPICPLDDDFPLDGI